MQHKDAKILAPHCNLNLGLVYGGEDYEKQRAQLEKGDRKSTRLNSSHAR